MPDAPKNRAELLRVMADHVWEQERNRKITEYWRATADYDAIHVRMRLLLRAIEAAGCVVVPMEDIELRGLIAELAKIVANHSFGTTDQHSAFALLKRAEALAAGPYREG